MVALKMGNHENPGMNLMALRHEMKAALLPVDLLDPIFEPLWFLVQDHNQYYRCNRDGDDSIEDGKQDKVNQNLGFDGQFEPLYTKEGFE